MFNKIDNYEYITQNVYIKINIINSLLDNNLRK